MDMRALSEHFLSVGGSARFGDDSKFGRIGIGSLALLQYGQTVTVETKVAGANTYCVAELCHGEWIKEASRRDLLADVPAGTAHEVPYDGDACEHFTRIRLEGPNAVVLASGADPTVRAELVDRLRRVLPLPWPSNRLTEALDRAAPDLTRELASHASLRSAAVVVHSSWDDGVALVRRQFGDRAGLGEDWTGPLFPVHKRLRVDQSRSPRHITVAGYLLSQTHASAAWSGVTARVQNVAVEENTFFDVVADPGFRKYITGEIYLLGDIDRQRLINIDRASFNRESDDYLSAQRYVADVLQRFKVRYVQQPQRLKVSARKLVQDHGLRLAAIKRVIEVASAMEEKSLTGLPSSGTRFKSFADRSLESALASIGCGLEESDGPEPVVAVSGDGTVVCRMPNGGARPSIEVGRRSYLISFGDAGEDELPVVIRNRPREVLFNLSHPAHRGKPPEALARTLALEIAYLSSGERGPDELFERILGLLAVA
jgi:hypothetical protein